jgi:hypothetical protein
MTLPRKNLKKTFLCSMLRFNEPQAEIVLAYWEKQGGDLAAILRDLVMWAIALKNKTGFAGIERRTCNYMPTENLRRQSDCMH